MGRLELDTRNLLEQLAGPYEGIGEYFVSKNRKNFVTS